MDNSLLYLPTSCATNHPLDSASRSGSQPHINSRLLSHLSLDRFVRCLAVHETKQTAFLQVLSDPVTDWPTVRYRQAVLQNFLDTPDLLSTLSALSARFQTLLDEQKQVGKKDFRLKVGGNASLPELRSQLCEQALCLRRALLLLSDMADALNAAPLSAPALLSLRDTCNRKTEPSARNRLLSLCDRCADLPEAVRLPLRLILDSDGRVCSGELMAPAAMPELERKKISRFARRPREETPPKSIPITPVQPAFYSNLTLSALTELSELFAALFTQIAALLAPLRKEMAFYEVGLRYVHLLREKTVPITFPCESPDGSIRICQLYDPFLLVSENPANVIPNDLTMPASCRGIAVFGENGSGKTVFLRSLGCLQTLAQAGLPVPAAEASLPLSRQIATRFAESEKRTAEADAGRFEQEVREMAELVESLHPGDLVFLNELFQSTAYDEGAEGLYHLLEYLSARNVRWILVSHLRQLKPRFAPQRVALLHTAPGYRVLPDTP